MLRGFAYFGVPLGLWVIFAGIVVAYHSAGRAFLLVSFGAALSLANLGLLWHPLSWRAAEILWTVGAAGSIVWFWTSPLSTIMFFTCVSLIPLAAMIAHRKPMLARLSGSAPAEWEAPASAIPDPGPCDWCGNPRSTVRAPLWCMSALFVSLRRPGRARNVCVTHARIRALPATLFSAVFGWWGIPWGFIWTPMAILDNLLEGGVEIDRSTLVEMRSREPNEGGFIEAVALFSSLLLVPLLSLQHLFRGN